VGGLDTTKFVIPTLIHYESFDSMKIPAFLYKPPASKAREGKFPVVIRIHGGPESQSRPDFFPMIQYYCNELGVASLVPNVRGSSGYGRTYLTLDDGYKVCIRDNILFIWLTTTNKPKREDSVKDIGALIDWARQQPELDPDRIMVNGGSYGGYMVLKLCYTKRLSALSPSQVLAAMIHFGEKLRAGVERVGISNWVTFLENTADYRCPSSPLPFLYKKPHQLTRIPFRKDLRRVEYGDERIPEMREFLLKISPLANAHQINKPMLIAQGKKRTLREGEGALA